MKKASIILLVVGGLIVLVGLTAAGCRRLPATNTVTEQPTETPDNTVVTPNQTQQNTPPEPTTASGLPDATAAKPLLDTELKRATDAIKQLKPDAVLKLVSMKFINSLSDQSGLATNYYIFSAASDPKFYYLVNAPRNGERIKRFIMPVEDLELPFDLVDLPFQFWKLSYVQALNISEQKGGLAFRTQHPKFEASAILAKPAGQYLSWFVTYRATDGSGAVLKVSVDAFTGEANEIK